MPRRSRQGESGQDFAQLTLGHNSKTVHRAYARKVQVTLPPLEDYEKTAMAAPVIPLPVSSAGWLDRLGRTPRFEVERVDLNTLVGSERPEAR